MTIFYWRVLFTGLAFQLFLFELNLNSSQIVCPIVVCCWSVWAPLFCVRPPLLAPHWLQSNSQRIASLLTLDTFHVCFTASGGQFYWVSTNLFKLLKPLVLNSYVCFRRPGGEHHLARQDLCGHPARLHQTHQPVVSSQVTIRGDHGSIFFKLFEREMSVLSRK